MIRLHASTVLLQWAAGGMLFLWVTTRRREVSLGYGWVSRTVFAAMVGGAIYIGVHTDPSVVRDFTAAVFLLAIVVAQVVSVVRRGAGVAGVQRQREARRQRVEAMVASTSYARNDQPDQQIEDVVVYDSALKEFPPILDFVAAALGMTAVLAGVVVDGGPLAVSILRGLVGAAFLGCVSSAMMLGHWYLTQPGLSREPLVELNGWLIKLWPAEVIVLLLPPGMAGALRGEIDDGYGGLLIWFWVACVMTTICLAVVTSRALRERYYSAVMASTGFLYLAILTAFGTDLVARAILADF